MAAEFLMIPDAPEPVAPFSHVVIANGFAFITGQMPTVPGREEDPLPTGVEAQTRQVMSNLKTVLAGVGLGLEDVVQCKCYLTEFERDYATFNRVYREHFSEKALPSRTTIGVTALALGALVEIDMIATTR